MKRSIGRGTRAWQGALVICDVYNRDVYLLMRGYRLRDYVPQEKGVLDEVWNKLFLGLRGRRRGVTVTYKSIKRQSSSVHPPKKYCCASLKASDGRASPQVRQPGHPRVRQPCRRRSPPTTRARWQFPRRPTHSSAPRHPRRRCSFHSG